MCCSITNEKSLLRALDRLNFATCGTACRTRFFHTKQLLKHHTKAAATKISNPLNTWFKEADSGLVNISG